MALPPPRGADRTDHLAAATDSTAPPESEPGTAALPLLPGQPSTATDSERASRPIPGTLASTYETHPFRGLSALPGSGLLRPSR